ncbi:MAG: hypothetical protein DRJ60_05365 [Thermoprotei archaeon]|nr:MAG: hypothetical protein DRJ60_05365 [Thermoprotei archaeon]
MACITEDIIEEILKAIKMAVELKSRGLNQAAIQSSLNKMTWRCVEPISVGDDYSLVFKISGLKPCNKGEIEAQEIGEVVEPIRNFPLVVKLDKGYIAIGSSALRTSLNVSKEALTKIIRLCVKP